MVIQGAAGNIAPKYFNSALTPIDAKGSEYVRTATALDEMAKVIYERVAERISIIDVSENLSSNMYSKYISLNAKIPSFEEAKHIVVDAKRYCGIDGSQWLQEIARLQDEGISNQQENCEMQYFSIGQWCMCGVPYEIMVEFALEPMQIL